MQKLELICRKYIRRELNSGQNFYNLDNLVEKTKINKAHQGCVEYQLIG